MSISPSPTGETEGCWHACQNLVVLPYPFSAKRRSSDSGTARKNNRLGTRNQQVLALTPEQVPKLIERASSDDARRNASRHRLQILTLNQPSPALLLHRFEQERRCSAGSWVWLWFCF